MKKLSRKFWIYTGISIAALVGLIVSLVKGWNIGAVLFAIGLIIAAMFAVKEYHNGGTVSDLQIESAQIVDSLVIVRGIAFAENPGDIGAVYVNDKTGGKILSWGDSEIAYKPEQKPVSGDAVYVINGDGQKSNTIGVE